MGQQGGGHCHQGSHHHGQALHRASQEGILGEQDRETPHCTLQGYRKVWFYLGPPYPCSSWYWHSVSSCTQETATDGCIEDCYTSAKGSTGTLGNFAKATYAAIAETYAYLTPDLWKETVFQKSPFQEYTDFLAKNHRVNTVQR